MTPAEAFARRLAAEIRHELVSLDRIRDQNAAAPRDNEVFILRARGSILHDFYNGIERVFVRIAEELDGGVPQGDGWHRQLVTDMSIAIPGVRPAVIDAALADALGEFLRFRHVFRNVYGFVLDPKRMRPLEERLPVVMATFRTQIEAFLTWLEGGPPDS